MTAIKTDRTPPKTAQLRADLLRRSRWYEESADLIASTGTRDAEAARRYAAAAEGFKGLIRSGVEGLAADLDRCERRAARYGWRG